MCRGSIEPEEIIENIGRFQKEKQMSKFSQIQKEMIPWQQHNFPGRSSWMPLMGLGEELGELARAFNEEECIDALGDCCIYLADYCNGMGYDLDVIIYDLEPSMRIFDYQKAMSEYGILCHSHLKQSQRIRMHEDHKGNGKQAIRNLISFFCTFSKIKLEDIAWETWEKVRQRDWQKDHNKAHEQKTTSDT